MLDLQMLLITELYFIGIKNKNILRNFKIRGKRSDWLKCFKIRILIFYKVNPMLHVNKCCDFTNTNLILFSSFLGKKVKNKTRFVFFL